MQSLIAAKSMERKFVGFFAGMMASSEYFFPVSVRLALSVP